MAGKSAFIKAIGTNLILAQTLLLGRLSLGNTVLVTSHDIELSRLLPEQYTSFHFQETTDLANMFDYKLREGNCTSRNAITLLEAIGFPSDVISVARSIVSDLES